MGATILRQWLVLAMLPRSPRRIDTASIEARLRDRGIEVHRRTIQRDLLELAEVFPIVADERAKPYGWGWSDHAGHPCYLPAPSRSGGAAWIDVSLRVRRAAIALLLEWLGARNLRIVSEDPDEPASVIVLVEVEDSCLTRRVLLGYGDELEVIAPLALRKEVVDRAQRVLAVHSR